MKKSFFALALFLFLAGYTTAFGQDVFQANQRVELNGLPFYTVAPLLNVNDRLMVPFREFGYALGAEVGWYGDFQRITMFRDNMYSILHIGSDIVQHGEFVITAWGQTQLITQNNAVMDSPAMLHNDLTYIPLRAVAESLGAVVDWNPVTSTATITTLTPLPEAREQEQEDEEEEVQDTNLPPNYGDFSNTSHFSIISSRQAQARHNDSNEHPLILVVYNSDQHQSRLVVPDIQDAAQRVGHRVFGLDRAAPTNIESENNWIWNFVREAAFQEPAVLFIHNRNHVEMTTMPTLVHHSFNLDNAINNFRILSETGFNPGDFRNTNWFTNVSSADILQMYSRNDEFIFVLYDSQNENSYFYVPVLKAAARDAQHRIFAVDVDINPHYRIHLDFAPGLTPNLSHRMPMVFLVYSPDNQNNTTVSDRPGNLFTATNLLGEFLNNSLFFAGATQPDTSPNQNFVDLHHNNFINSSASTILNMFNRGEDFVVVVYDSQVANTMPIAEAIRDAAIASLRGVYAVNLSSNTVTHTHDDLAWLRLALGNNTVTHPTMIHFRSFAMTSAPLTFNHTNIPNIQREAHDFIIRVLIP
ncbi:MAG: copper amine oxidase N-terminal domain-containing protein [Defluviitaleaceae bacterium]|nr:copper amine oxidase N-terminal domain-containing protein [Defluviitaleaceae bacterium]